MKLTNPFARRYFKLIPHMVVTILMSSALYRLAPHQDTELLPAHILLSIAVVLQTFIWFKEFCSIFKDAYVPTANK